MAPPVKHFLSLKRRCGERVIIGQGEDQVTVEVRRSCGASATLVIAAPLHIRVDREEVANRIAKGE